MTVGDAGFEVVSVGTGSSASQYDPNGSLWTFTGQTGVAGNGSGFTSGNPAAPQGTQVAFLQSNTGSISQSLDFEVPGSYVVSFQAAQLRQLLHGSVHRQCRRPHPDLRGHQQRGQHRLP